MIATASPDAPAQFPRWEVLTSLIHRSERTNRTTETTYRYETRTSFISLAVPSWVVSCIPRTAPKHPEDASGDHKAAYDVRCGERDCDAHENKDKIVLRLRKHDESRDDGDR